jgi:hypothetical protein
MPSFLTHRAGLTRPVGTGLSVLLATLGLWGCGDALTLANYNRLQVGQSYDEVRQIIGEPSRCDEALGVRSCQWG